MRNTLAIGVGLVVLSMAIPAMAQDPVRVYVFTANAQYVNAVTKGLADSTVNIQDAIKKKRTLALVTTAENADVVVEVLSREGSPAKVKAAMLTGIFALRSRGLRVKVIVGDYSTEMVGMGNGQGAVWRTAASDVVKQVDRWVKDNNARLPHK